MHDGVAIAILDCRGSAILPDTDRRNPTATASNIVWHVEGGQYGREY